MFHPEKILIADATVFAFQEQFVFLNQFCIPRPYWLNGRDVPTELKGDGYQSIEEKSNF